MVFSFYLIFLQSVIINNKRNMYLSSTISIPQVCNKYPSPIPPYIIKIPLHTGMFLKYVDEWREQFWETVLLPLKLCKEKQRN